MSLARWISPSRPKYTLDQFKCEPGRAVCQELLSYGDVNYRNKDRVIECLRTIAEALVWSEQNKQDFFMCGLGRFFLEQKLTAHIKLLLTRQSDRTVALQLIQTISILSHNISTKASRSKTHTVYFHANDFLNDVISFNFDFADEEIAEHYMSWLKGLATNLTADMMQYYFTRGTCPLLVQAQRFYNYPEPMTKTAARTIALCLFKTKHPQIISLAIDSRFFTLLICYIREQWRQIDDLISAATIDNLQKLQIALDEQVDNFYYLNDIFCIEYTSLNDALGEELLRYLLLPLVAGALGASSGRRTSVTIQLAEYMFVHVLSTLRYPGVLDALVAAIFLKETSPGLLDLCLGDIPQPPPGYSFIYRPNDAVVLKRSEREPRGPEALIEVSTVIDWVQGLTELPAKVRNPIRQELFTFLRSRDDNLIMLTCLALQALLVSPDVHRSLLTTAGLLPQSQSRSQALFDSLVTDGTGATEESGPKRIYNSEVLEQLLHLLCTDPPFRLSTSRLICQLVLTLTRAPGEDGNLLPTHLRILNKATSISISRIKTLIKKSFYSDLFLDLFEEEWETVRRLDFSSAVPCVVTYLLPMLDDMSSGVVLADRLPFGEIETARRDTHIFFLLLKLRNLLGVGENLDDCEVFRDAHISWEEGKAYAMDEREFIRCALKEGREQSIRYFAEDPHFFILVVPDADRTHWAKIATLTSLKNVEAMIDRSDPRALVLALKKGRDSAQVVLGFDSPLLCHKVKKLVDAHRKEAKERGLAAAELMLKRLEELLES